MTSYEEAPDDERIVTRFTYASGIKEAIAKYYNGDRFASFGLVMGDGRLPSPFQLAREYAICVISKLRQLCVEKVWTAIGAENKVAQAVEESFYVDDFLKSETSEEEAIDMVAKMRKLLQNWGFNITKWASNSRKVLETIPEQHRAKDVTGIDLQNDKLSKEHVLGVKWCAESDSLEFSAKTVSKIATRRNILSVVSGIYDPLGICSPYTLQAKLILQSLCREKMGWDDPIPAQS
ncbi:uncharacterized protein LOC117100240 [Anneissia japonica]|uniref:uncharacterized protein LOC117100240 n=1 Tax=Anneissia japonica TaxID=1529436 RepID=UPI001425B9C8|nr:uncharacterized protein LOC117100240 [Anneissia japonica]